jgi:hypothetical protein
LTFVFFIFFFREREEGKKYNEKYFLSKKKMKKGEEKNEKFSKPYFKIALFSFVSDKSSTLSASQI